MRVLAFSDVAPPEGTGGVERALVEVYGRLTQSQSAEIAVFALADRRLPREDERAGLRIVRAARLPLERITGAQASVSLPALPRAVRLARAMKPDVIHAHTLFFFSSVVAAVTAASIRKPLVLTVHVGPVDRLPQPHRFLTRLYEMTIGRALLKRARRIICVSEDVAVHVRRLGASPGKVTVIPNGVDATRYVPGIGSGAAEPVVICVGRLIFNKGQQVLLEALAKLHDEAVSFRLLLVGDGPMEQQLRRQAAELGIESVVEFAGARDDVAELLKRADIFVRPSFTEGMSLAVLEAMSAALPVVATDVAGSRELIRPGVDGLIVPPGDVPALAQALRAMLRMERAERERMGCRARERALEFSWDAVASRTLKELQDAAA
jgi:glycosyltransferase involved in cell wall biosynthesis